MGRRSVLLELPNYHWIVLRRSRDLLRLSCLGISSGGQGYDASRSVPEFYRLLRCRCQHYVKRRLLSDHLLPFRLVPGRQECIPSYEWSLYIALSLISNHWYNRNRSCRHVHTRLSITTTYSNASQSPNSATTPLSSSLGVLSRPLHPVS